MKRVTTILVPFNFTETAQGALNYAIHFVGKKETIKIVLAYISEDYNDNRVEKRFSDIKKEYNPLLKQDIECVSVKGPLTDSLLKIKKEKKADFIIMGTFGTLDMEDDEPTNTSNFVHEADCPVLVIPLEFEKFRIKKIALVLGQEEIEDTKVLGILLDIARDFNAKVHVVTVQNRPEVYGYSEIDEKNENAIHYYLEDFYAEHSFIENPDIVKGVFSYTMKKDIDLIAILPRNHTKYTEPSKGELTKMLTLHSELPVLALD